MRVLTTHVAIDAPPRAVKNSLGNAAMPTVTDSGSLILRSDAIRGGRPRIAGTGLTVRRMVGWDKQGWTPEAMLTEVPPCPWRRSMLLCLITTPIGKKLTATWPRKRLRRST